MNKFYFPMETMNVTQNYNGKVSHYNHSHGIPVDYPIDIAGAGSGQSAVFAPVDMRVTAIRGVGNSATNTIWLVSKEEVQTPTFTDYVFMTLTHWNDSDPMVKKLKVGSIVKAGEIICYEGTDGATGNHIHLVCGRGEASSWLQNNKGSWVIKGVSLPPEQVMFINDNFTKCKSSGRLVFKSMPKTVYYKKCASKYTSIVDALNSIKVDSSFSNRKKIAKVNKITSYLGLPTQNKKMLALLKQGKLIKE